MCEAIYIDNTHQTSRKTTDGNSLCILFPIKNIKKQTHLIPILNRTLNLLHRVQTYTSEWR